MFRNHFAIAVVNLLVADSVSLTSEMVVMKNAGFFLIQRQRWTIFDLFSRLICPKIAVELALYLGDTPWWRRELGVTHGQCKNGRKLTEWWFWWKGLKYLSLYWRYWCSKYSPCVPIGNGESLVMVWGGVRWEPASGSLWGEPHQYKNSAKLAKWPKSNVLRSSKSRLTLSS